ncbi:TNF receptor-associated factor 1-like [Haemaphysalis longicornis]
MAGRRNLRRNRQPAVKHEQSTFVAVREGRNSAAVAITPNFKFLAAENRSISDLRSKLDEVCREVELIKNNLADLEAILSTLSALQYEVRNEMKKMREEASAVNKRILMKIEKIHNFITGESDTGKERPRSSKFDWHVNSFSKLKDQMLKGKAKSFFSENFYVGIHGYKMYLGANFAEKNVKGKISLSIYAYITRGPYDRTLQWPYRRRSTFIIVDQKTNSHHKVAEVVPEDVSRKLRHCLQRPKNGPNEGIGFTAMISLEELEDPEKGYLMNDSFLVHFIAYDV